MASMPCAVLRICTTTTNHGVTRLKVTVLNWIVWSQCPGDGESAFSSAAIQHSVKILCLDTDTPEQTDGHGESRYKTIVHCHLTSKHTYTAVFRETFISMYKWREKSLKLPIVVYDIINTYLYSIVYTYIECVFMCFYFLAKFLLNFCGSATFRNGNKKKRKEKPFTTDFCSHTVKHTYSRKGFSTPAPKIHFRYLL